MRKASDPIAALPELPLKALELGGKLAHARRGPYLTIMPPERPDPTPPKRVITATPLAPTSSFEIRKYFTQAIYPRVICHDPGELISGVVMARSAKSSGRAKKGVADRAAAMSAGDLTALAEREAHYKLTKLDGRKLHHALWCTVKYGPWLAVAKETESCIAGEANRWEFWIVEVPEVSMVWYGQWLDQPTLPNLTVIKGDLAPAGVTRQCCAGYKWCPTTQSCIPNTVTCQQPTPV